MPFYLRSSCPGLPGRERDRRAYIHLLLGLHPPLPMAIPPRTSSMPLQGQSPSPECKPQLTQVTQHHPGTLPPVPLRSPSEKAKPGETGCGRQPRAARPCRAPGCPSVPRCAHLGRAGVRARRRPGAGGAGRCPPRLLSHSALHHALPALLRAGQPGSNIRAGPPEERRN